MRTRHSVSRVPIAPPALGRRLLAAWLAVPLAVTLVVLGAVVPVVGQTAAPEPALAASQAPTRLHAEPNVYGLVTLPGDLVTLRYSAGHLDRAARLQARLEPPLKAIRDWAGVDDVEVVVYLLGREDWERARIQMPYGVPVRVGRTALAAPALGDDGTVGLWGTLGVGLPSAQDAPLRGTPQQQQSMELADALATLHLSEIVVDRAGLGGDAYWVRSLVTHVGVAEYLDRYQPEIARDLDLVWQQIGRLRAPDTFGTSDYRPEIGLLDWLWFQSQFDQGADLLVDEEGRGTLRKVRKIGERTDGPLRGAALLDRYPGLEGWFDRTFSAVSLRRT